MNSYEKIYVPAFISFIPCLLIFPGAAFSGAAGAVKLSLSTLIPSLFAFMVMSEAVILMLSDKKLPFCLFSRLLKVDKCCEGAILLSFIGGYPVGARCISALYTNGRITKGEARRLSLCLINPSPVFIISAVGMKMLSSIKAGIILCISVYIANIIVSLSLVFFKDLQEFSGEKVSHTRKRVVQHASPADIMVNSVKSSSIAMLYICMFTVFFGTVSGVFSAFIKNEYILSAVNGILEVTVGCKAFSDAGILYLPFFAATLCFGGLCVMLQILCFGSEYSIPAGHYLLSRVAASVIAFAIARALSVFYSPSVSVFNNTSGQLSPQSDYGFFSSILVVTAAVVFVLSTSKNFSRYKKRSRRFLYKQQGL